MSDNLLSQEEIDALLSGESGVSTPPSGSGGGGGGSDDALLSMEEIDALAEIGNLSTGAMSTVLSTILNNTSEIVQPQIKEETVDEIVTKYQGQQMCLVTLKYVEGFNEPFYLLMKKENAVVIMDLMMGADGSSPPDEPDEIYISAIEEAVNQMMGSSNTSLSTMFSKSVSTDSPKIKIGAIESGLFNISGKAVEMIFSMKLGDIIDDEISMILSVDFAKQMVGEILGTAQEAPPLSQMQPEITADDMDALLGGGMGMDDISEPIPQPMPEIQQPVAQQAPPQQQQYAPPPQQQAPPQQQQYAPPPQQQYAPPPQQQYAPPPQQQYAPPQQQYPPQFAPTMYGMPQQIRPVQFSELARTQNMDVPNNLELLLDVPLQITVELGRTKKVIKDILELGNGSVIELDKQAGESIDILVNNKLIAKGEVVVIDENFGVRITSIVSPSERLQNLIGNE